MDNGVDRSAPATKGDVLDILETMRDIQTELLKAFYTYAQSTDLKLKETEIADFTARQRITAVESRVTDLEKRLNMPPQR
jgi:hypothetical protein